MGAVMITRALVLALWCACATALAPVASAGDDDCALYLNGPGRTSAYDYSLNLLKGNFGYEGQNTCITYDAVNQAYHDARQRIVVSQPKGEWKPEDYASVGELVLDVSINLARMYGLTYEEIEKGLPLIDTSRTLIREVCPPVFSHVECRAGKYRRLDGLCNNLQHPTWGATNAPFQRLIGPLFADGINAPRISHTGHDLPLSRVVSRTMHPDDGFHDHAGTVMVIAWGQFMDHDYTLTGTPLDPRNRNDPEECCKRPPHLKHPYCNEIRVPDDDYFYRLFSVKCIDFVRAFPSPRPGCRLGSRVPFNTLTGALDGNTVYGVTDKFARKLRTGYGGLLRMNPVFKEYGLKDLLPLKLDIPDEGCTRPNKNMYCFEAGEIRVNEQLVLTVMHTLMAREHNRVAGALAAVNPHWDDETLYQEARRINIAEIQHITYNEFLPILLGKDVMEKFGLVVEKEGYWDGYDPHVNADVIDAFAAAAYRFGHSLLPTAVERWSKAHKFIASKRLSDLIRRPYDLYRAGVLDEYVMGLMNQVAQAMDDSITQEVTNHLFKKVGARFGMDLVSFNMQRGREFGLPGYMEFRKFCGLSGADSFQDLFGTMSNDTVRKYETIFSHPVDVDLWSGGVSERPLPGSMLGPTFACVIATQFSYSRRGDRFWYELPNQPSSFTAEQLAEIRKSRLARVICDNTDIIDSVQLYPMVLPDHELNPRVPCRSGILPSIDFTKWAEPAPFHSAKQFVTEAVISVQNETQCDEITENIEINNAEPCNNDTALDKGCECNETVVSSTALNPETTVQNNKLNLMAHNSTDRTNENDSKFTQEKTHNAKNHDAVLKISKNDKETNMHNKTTGHPKNSLRKKRSLNHNEDARYAESVPLIVNYKTSHSDEERDKPFERIRNVIKNSDLADFNIETLHENSQPKNKQNVQLQHQTKYILPKVQHKKSESNEDDNREYPIRNSEDEKSYNSKDSSEERDQYNDDNKKPEHGTDSHSYRENKDSIKTKQKPQYDRNESSRESDDSRENNEESEYTPRNNSYKKKEDSAENSREPEYENNKDSYREREDSVENQREPRYKENANTSYKDTDDSRETKDVNTINNYRDSEERKGKEDYVDDKENFSQENAPYVNNHNVNENDGNNRKLPYPDERDYSNKENQESNERDYYNKAPKLVNNKESYDDLPKQYPPNSESHENKQSEESNYPRNDFPRNRKESYSGSPKQSQDIYENESNKGSSSVESQEYDKSDDEKSPYTRSNTESKETKDFIENDSSEQRQPSTNSDSVEDKYNSEINLKENPTNSYLKDNNDDEEEEAIIAIMKKKRPQVHIDHDELNTRNDQFKPIKISYETNHVNNKGLVAPLEVGPITHENYDTDSQVEIAPTATPIPIQLKEEIEQFSRSIESIEEPINSDVNSKTPININDGDIRPVVEINSDNSEESQENSKETFKTNPDKEDTSLERLLGVKLTDNEDKNEKIVEGKNKENVKQQFERIPLNYNHDKTQQIDDNKNGLTVQQEHSTTEPENNAEEHNDQGTVDTFVPENHNYDEKLNIKFDDVAIKLPEIKLPADILSYTYEEPSYDERKQKKKPKFYQYSDEYVDEDTPKNNNYKNKKEKDDEDDEHDEKRDELHHSYPSYYSNDERKNEYRKNEKPTEEDEDIDLYEKFVRERFGKRGSFEKRSEKLQNAPLRPVESDEQLYSTLQQVLKKTEDLKQQAEKSGDPKAGFMWTLEYGKKLR